MSAKNPLFTLTIKNWCFAPSRTSTIIVSIIFLILIILGSWHLYEAQKIVRIQQQIEAAKTAKPLLLNQHLKVPPAQLKGRRVEVTGHFDNRYQFLQDNRFYNHRAGYHVFVPFILDKSKKAILVNRGWVPEGAAGSAKHVFIAQKGAVTLRGMVSVPVVTFVMGNEPMGTTWPRHVIQVNPLQFSRAIGYPLMPIVLLLEPSQRYGFVREWFQNIPSPRQHYADAFQWFAIATILLLAFMAIYTRRKESGS